MDALELDKFENCELNMLPNLVKKCLIQKFGRNFTNREVYLPDTIGMLKGEIEKEVLREVCVESLEALAFLMWIEDMEREVGEEWLLRDVDDFSLDPASATKKIGDCIYTSRKFILRINELFSGNEYEAQMVNYVSRTGYGQMPNQTEHDWGGSQNMVYMHVNGDHYLVDVYAFEFHKELWAKAFQGKSKIDVLQKGKKWLDETDEKSDWLTRGLVRVSDS
jgi:hypothetical protein